LIKASDRSLAAHYEYDPYGHTITATGSYAAASPWRFSTKWHDSDLPGNVLIYYGYRYYSPRLGRWMNWDPIGEKGGLTSIKALVMLRFLELTPMGGALIWSCAVCACCAGQQESHVQSYAPMEAVGTTPPTVSRLLFKVPSSRSWSQRRVRYSMLYGLHCVRLQGYHETNAETSEKDTLEVM
jgi:RHS repeat-associated protein